MSSWTHRGSFRKEMESKDQVLNYLTQSNMGAAGDESMAQGLSLLLLEDRNPAVGPQMASVAQKKMSTLEGFQVSKFYRK